MMLDGQFLVAMPTTGQPSQDEVEMWLGYDGITMRELPEAPALGLFHSTKPLTYDQAAIANHGALTRRCGTELRRLAEDVVPKLMRSQARPAQKFSRLREIADKANALIAPSTPCHKGCGHCCHIAVSISYSEAYAIGLYTGRSPVAQPYAGNAKATMVKLDANVGRFSGKRCTFLGEHDQCTIYDARPMACRTHHVLGPNASRCDVAGGPQRIHSVNLQFLPNALAKLTVETEAFADIREYFPNSAGSP